MFTNVPLNAMRPTRWERLEEDRFYIGSHLAGTLRGDRARGYLINYLEENESSLLGKPRTLTFPAPFLNLSLTAGVLLCLRKDDNSYLGHLFLTITWRFWGKAFVTFVNF